MTDLSQIVRDLAVITAVRQILDAREKEVKAAARDGLHRGSIAATDGEGAELGLLVVGKPRQPAPRIDDLDQVIPWVLDNFPGADGTLAEMRWVLTEQGRASVLAAAKSGTVVPGVSVPDPVPATPSWRPAKDVAALVRGMVARGEVALHAVLEVES